MSRKKSTDFLKKLSKADKALYAYIGICSVLGAVRLSYTTDEYNQEIEEFTDDLKGYLNNVSLILRNLNVSCPDLQYKIDLDFNNEEYFVSILDRLQDYYSKHIVKLVHKFNEVRKLDFSKF